MRVNMYTYLLQPNGVQSQKRTLQRRAFWRMLPPFLSWLHLRKVANNHDYRSIERANAPIVCRRILAKCCARGDLQQCPEKCKD